MSSAYLYLGISQCMFPHPLNMIRGQSLIYSKHTMKIHRWTKKPQNTTHQRTAQRRKERDLHSQKNLHTHKSFSVCLHQKISLISIHIHARDGSILP
mmetsp:Transcript_851/g.1876  ORF Transcript_851/g.1876 Transcript_851/m.1876 type:complete len:97 (-) Transcript_851:928-1218(-)